MFTDNLIHVNEEKFVMRCAHFNDFKRAITPYDKFPVKQVWQWARIKASGIPGPSAVALTQWFQKQ